MTKVPPQLPVGQQRRSRKCRCDWGPCRGRRERDETANACAAESASTFECETSRERHRPSFRPLGSAGPETGLETDMVTTWKPRCCG